MRAGGPANSIVRGKNCASYCSSVVAPQRYGSLSKVDKFRMIQLRYLGACDRAGWAAGRVLEVEQRIVRHQSAAVVFTETSGIEEDYLVGSVKFAPRARRAARAHGQPRLAPLLRVCAPISRRASAEPQPSRSCGSRGTFQQPRGPITRHPPARQAPAICALPPPGIVLVLPRGSAPPACLRAVNASH